jgi:hypothetical protein
MSSKIISISPSTLNLYSSCARKFQFEKVLSFLPRNKSVSLEKGDLFHKFLESYYQGKIDQREQNIVRSIEDGRRHSINLGLGVNDIEGEVKVFKEYALHYAGENWIPIAVEKPFDIFLTEIDGYEFHLEGKIDLIVKQNEQITLVDHKTTSRFSDPSPLSHQFMAYAWALEQNLIIVNTIGLQESYTGAQRFRRAILNFDDSVLDEWRENASYICTMIKLGMEKGFFPPNFTSCDKYGGCMFRDICSTRPDTREYKLNRDFVKGEPYDIFGAK